MSSEILNLTAGELIRLALLDAKIIQAEQPIKSKDFKNGLNAMRLIIKHWQTQGIHLWSETEAVLPLIKGKRQYLLGPDGDEVALAKEFFNTTTTANLLTNDTIITLATTSGLTADGNNISIEGVIDLLDFQITASISNWRTSPLGIVSSDGTSITISNSLGTQEYAEYALDTVIGKDYRFTFTYTQGTSSTAIFSAVDSGGVVASITLNTSGNSVINFTARSQETFFRIQNGSSTINQTSSVSVVQYFDLASGDRLGIELDNGSRFWSDVISNDSAVQITLRNGIPSSVTSGNSVYAYRTSIARPMRLLQSRFANTITASEIPVQQWSGQEYFDQPDKDSSGTVVKWYYKPTLNIGELYVWQVANNINQILRFTYIDTIDVPENDDDSLEFPSEWYMPLKWAIASELGPQYGVSAERQVILNTNAAQTLEESLSFDVERSSMLIQPDYN